MKLSARIIKGLLGAIMVLGSIGKIADKGWSMAPILVGFFGAFIVWLVVAGHDDGGGGGGI